MIWDQEEIKKMKWKKAIDHFGIAQSLQIKLPHLPIWISLISVLMSGGVLLLTMLLR